MCPTSWPERLQRAGPGCWGSSFPLRDPIFFNQFIARALSGIQTTLMRRGYNLLVFSPSGKPGRDTRDQILESRFTDGLIFINTRSCTANDVSRTIEEMERGSDQVLDDQLLLWPGPDQLCRSG